MARNFLMTRRNWAVEGDADFMDAYGVWNFRAKMLDARPQVVAEAPDNRDWSATQFAMDFGVIRKVGLIYLINLRTSPLGLIEITAGTDSTFATYNYHVVTTTWPPDEADEFDYNAWDEFGLTHVYQPEEQLKLGYPRVFIPASVIDCRYIKVEIRDSTCVAPIQVGCFGACEVWEAPINFEFGWSVTPMDESDVQRVPFGTSEITERGMRRRLNVGFPSIDEDDFWVRPFGIALIKGRSQALVAAPLADAAEVARLEKAAVYGMVSNDSQLSNPFFGIWRTPFQVDQEI